MPRKGKRRGRQGRQRGPKRRHAPAAMTTQVFRASTALDTIRLKHREFICNISGSQDFVITQLPINPGLSTAFPWLSGIAVNFETYQFNRLAYSYVPSCSTTTDGAVIIAPDYDAADRNGLLSKGDILTFQDSVRSSWWADVRMTCTPRNLHKRDVHYIRGHGIPQGTDIKTYDVLSLNIGAQSSSETVLGELWVEYDVTLYTPQREAGRADPIHEISTGAGTVTEAQPFGLTTPIEMGEHRVIITGDGHGAEDFDNFEWASSLATGLTNRLSFRSPGQYSIAWMLEGITDWTDSPFQDIVNAGLLNDEAAAGSVTMHGEHYTAGSAAATAIFTIDAPHDCFHDYWRNWDVDTAPYIDFYGFGDYIANVSTIMVARTGHHEMAITS